MTHAARSLQMVSSQAMACAPRPLPRHCSSAQARRAEAIDTLLFESKVAAAGEFRCPTDHPAFSNSGPIERCIVVFPRSSVWIRHEGRQQFVADPNVVTIYNRGQRYERAPLSPDGDRCDWFAVSDDVARDIAQAVDPRAAENPERPFRFECVASDPRLYLKQRHLMARVKRGAVDALGLDDEITVLVASVLAIAYRSSGTSDAVATSASPARLRRREIAEHAKFELARTFTVNRSARDIAQAVGTSVYHLCRLFRAHTGRTMHTYRTELRIRAALERLPEGAGTLSTLAHDLGFASHAHLVRICRRHLGGTPGQVRTMLRGEAD